MTGLRAIPLASPLAGDVEPGEAAADPSLEPVVQFISKVEHVGVGGLKPYPNNARTHSKSQIRQIAASIERFGFTNPLLVDDDGVILAGHGRLAAAKLLCLERVPVLRLSHLSSAERRAYVLADNKLPLTLVGKGIFWRVSYKASLIWTLRLNSQASAPQRSTLLWMLQLMPGLTVRMNWTRCPRYPVLLYASLVTSGSLGGTGFCVGMRDTHQTLTV